LLYQISEFLLGLLSCSDEYILLISNFWRRKLFQRPFFVTFL
jgi:hypothetical protein